MLKVGAPGRVDLSEIGEKVHAGERLSFDDGLRLFESNDVVGIGRLANLVRERLHGDAAYFSHKYRIYPTNVCKFRCRFCAFRVNKGAENAYERPAAVTVAELANVDLRGVQEFHIVGGLHPDWGFEDYRDLVAKVHEAYPKVHIKAWTGVEVDHFATLTGKDVRWVLESLQEAGLSSLPGGGAEIFDWEVRRTICRTKCTGERWLEIHETAHDLGMKTNSTMLYGHVETPEVAQLGLSFGADDLDGTLIVDEEIIDAAGGNHVQGGMTKERFAAMIREAGRVPLERDTDFNVIREY